MTTVAEQVRIREPKVSVEVPEVPIVVSASPVLTIGGMINSLMVMYGMSFEEASTEAESTLKRLESHAAANAAEQLDKKLEGVWSGLQAQLEPFARTAASLKRGYSMRAVFPNREAMAQTLQAFIDNVPSEWTRPITLVLDTDDDGNLTIGTRRENETVSDEERAAKRCHSGGHAPINDVRFDGPKTVIQLEGVYPLKSQGKGENVYARCHGCKRIIRVGQDGNLVSHTPA